MVLPVTRTRSCGDVVTFRELSLVPRTSAANAPIGPCLRIDCFVAVAAREVPRKRDEAGTVIKLRIRSFGGEQQAAVRVAGATTYRRYAPDSVAFAGAEVSSLSGIPVGDHFRARGKKSGNGLEADAGEVVFGTFLTKAGIVRSVDTGPSEIAIEDLESKRPLVVFFRADSQLRYRMRT